MRRQMLQTVSCISALLCLMIPYTARAAVNYREPSNGATSPGIQLTTPADDVKKITQTLYNSNEDKDVKEQVIVDLLIAEDQVSKKGDVLEFTIRFCYDDGDKNQNKLACFNDLFKIYVLQNDVSCKNKYVSDQKYDGDTCVRNGKTVDFKMQFSVEPDVGCKIVLVTNNKSKAEYYEAAGIFYTKKDEDASTLPNNAP